MAEGEPVGRPRDRARLGTASLTLPSSDRPEVAAYRSPLPDPPEPAPARVSIRRIKEIARHLDPRHPLRILLQGEPDDMARSEFESKIVGWYRLLRAQDG